MISKTFLVSAVLAILATTSSAFTSSSRAFVARQQRVSRTAVDAVIDIGSEAAFDKTIKESGAALVVVDYSTTWCGPCKGVYSSA
jgi:thioredoxin 1